MKKTPIYFGSTNCLFLNGSQSANTQSNSMYDVGFNCVVPEIDYIWGKDLSGTLQGAGGVGGLLYETIDGVIYIPCYDNNGNITKYVDANGNVVASYTYDAFGKLIAKAGALADFFRHRFSTKYFDVETELY